MSIEPTQADRMLIEAIINDYHTTRLDSDYVSHILSKPRTQAALARHRLASTPASGEVERHAEKLAECLAKACGDIAALLIFGSREGDIRPWTAEYAAVLNAYDGKYETPAYPRPSWQAPTHADDCEAMQRPRADCTCLPVAAPSHPAADLVAILHQYRSDMLRPPAPDSRERRVAMIDAAIAKFGGV